jgi:hypothetical protein
MSRRIGLALGLTNTTRTPGKGHFAMAAAGANAHFQRPAEPNGDAHCYWQVQMLGACAGLMCRGRSLTYFFGASLNSL